ncbi:MAG: hypothetical protein HOF74_08070 [Gammaproteobacteria bacterium]|jgi:hypothetical protein|nr:hypothetical protein [Gammaproteobacteria bacterium]MBT3859769.1 hypothetical protein [Gammaproteobacteria bacterium]MBT3988836.1 hypothetical protein [Gammaproteobacteria bacterium]MBT4257376.1 hypothetical protein [Gammaproteobacteria bacterium]MBT4582241.1 hypothetical protein [Gammaproteobacteria bacterium]
MTEEEFHNWVAAYIEIYSGKEEFDEFHPQYWAIEKFVDLEADSPEICWAAVLIILRNNPDERVLANLAAGPLEELIELHGNDFIDRIEKESRSSPLFRSMLQGVWETTDEVIWNRVLKARLDS